MTCDFDPFVFIEIHTNHYSLPSASVIYFDSIINSMEPVTTVTTAWTIAKTAGEISKKLYELGKSLKDREAKQQIDEITDKLRELKQSASELEDENRELREELRFKGDDYDFRTPFYYEKAHPERPLCPKCFAKKIAAPMGDPGMGCAAEYRICLACSVAIRVIPRSRHQGGNPSNTTRWS